MRLPVLSPAKSERLGRFEPFHLLQSFGRFFRFLGCHMVSSSLRLPPWGGDLLKSLSNLSDALQAVLRHARPLLILPPNGRTFLSLFGFLRRLVVFFAFLAAIWFLLL
jgi:hypothetical protein